ncbi:Peptidyl-dipeptidase dcp [Salinivirga cyanobacteriivorans]|uniref:Peptidyl-dipeptidase dcp n=1 Tax=Salinivirga cyanobacteriivorans TaxID=1307839 RepID=A0A0S2I434_9BACT|nr:M3 family metallopeptidase [Salinivirga cyanobacteriivorans]ALO17103.1 Peptidyl-dipeptidase dcp [Salinivirga cyanobacteriivorans]
MTNPFFQKQATPYQTPAFDKIKIEHYKPALEKAIDQARDQVKQIVENSEKPGFYNTIEALERSGDLIEQVAGIFFNLNEAETNGEMQALAPDLSAMITDFANEVNLNQELFKKVKDVRNSKPDLNKEQEMLLDNTYKSFVKGGADLPEKDKERYRAITRELSQLSLRFNENVLAETNAFELHITDAHDLSGLPDYVKSAAKEEAEHRDKEGWVFTLHHPSYVPFMQHADSRRLREKLYRAFSTRGHKGDKHDNKEIIQQIVNLRLEKARLLGYENYAAMVLEDRMALSANGVTDLLNQLYTAGHPHAVKDKEAVETLANDDGLTNGLQRWDWAYYSEKLRKKRFNLTDEMTKPYFKLERVIDAVFDLAGQLYQLSFKPNSDIPVYHQDVKAYEVYEGEQQDIKAILYLDFHPRKGKGQGAWMTTFREQSQLNGQYQAPFVSLVTNFTKPTNDKPALLTFDEVTTFLHEFGHALHAMLSNVTYESLSCTNVYRDFVELPSQMHENWAYEKEWLDKWAFHYESGAKIPDDLINRIRKAKNFNSGYANDRQVSFGWVDMAWHTLEQPFEGDVVEFEREVMQKAEVLPPADGTAFCTAFGHIFGGGYAAGYYGYKWAEVLDADAFERFYEEGIFNKTVAKSFAENILKKGGTAHPMELYKAFRGKEPSVEPLLKREGLL